MRISKKRSLGNHTGLIHGEGGSVKKTERGQVNGEEQGRQGDRNGEREQKE
jgi:hypothetical protein